MRASRKPDALEIQSALERAGAQLATSMAPAQEPVTVPPQRQDELLISVAGEQNWQQLPIIGERTGATGAFDLALQRCGSCATAGTLISELHATGAMCPRCRAGELVEAGGWVT